MLTVWLLWAAVLLLIIATYSRIDPTGLYNVSRGGVAGGLSRALVELNFPIAFVALAVLLLSVDVLGGWASFVAIPSGLLCLVTAYPGVVDQGDLDARPINALPALGVFGAVVLHGLALHRSGGDRAPARAGDRWRSVVAAAVAVLALPYVAAGAGVYLPDVVFLTGRRITDAEGLVHAAVHHGHHHGFDGALLMISALVLSRPLLRRPLLAAVTGGFLGLMFAYGTLLFVQDSWNEQIVARGWTSWSIPSPILPGLRPVWLVIVVLAVATAVALRIEARHDRHRRVGR